MIERTIARPIPVPFALVVKRGWKILPKFSLSRPFPVSLTAIPTQRESSCDAFIVTRRSLQALSQIASTVLANAQAARRLPEGSHLRSFHQ